MKTLKWMTLTLIFLGATVSEASLRLGGKCGLVDQADIFKLQNVDSMQLTWRSKFSDLEKRQIIQTSPLGSKDTHNALADLIENSESGEVYYESGSFKGREYQVVLYFPGGSPAGLIFRKGQEKPLAEIQDSDIICR